MSQNKNQTQNNGRKVQTIGREVVINYNNNNEEDNIFNTREFIPTNEDEGHFSLKIKTFNTLADRYADNSPQGFSHVDPAALAWENRKHKLLAEIISHDADLICLQEVDHWFDWFEPELQKYGYSGIFHSANVGEHGCALLYKAADWRASIKAHNYKNYSPQAGGVFILGLFTHKVENVKVVAGVTHLKAKEPFSAIRLIQGQILHEVASQYAEYPTVLVGDFNADPDEPVVDFFYKHYTSAYSNEPGTFTTMKLRDKLYKRVIDYIWFNDKFVLKSTLELLNSDDVPSPYLPSELYPSDHIALMAELAII